MNKNYEFFILEMMMGAVRRELIELPEDYIEFKQLYMSKYTKLHSDLIDMILKKL